MCFYWTSSRTFGTDRVYKLQIIKLNKIKELQFKIHYCLLLMNTNDKIVLTRNLMLAVFIQQIIVKRQQEIKIIFS